MKCLEITSTSPRESLYLTIYVLAKGGVKLWEVKN